MSGLPNPRSMTSSPARRASIFSASMAPNTYGGSALMRRNSMSQHGTRGLPAGWGSLSDRIVPRVGTTARRADRRPIRSSPVSEVQAVLLDLGGVFYLPDHDRMVAALARLDLDVDRDRLDEAHYRGSPRSNTSRRATRSLARVQPRLRAGVRASRRRADAASTCSSRSSAAGGAWTRVIPGSRAALRELHDLGVGLAVVSNADGTVEAQLLARRDLPGRSRARRPGGEVILDSAWSASPSPTRRSSSSRSTRSASTRPTPCSSATCRPPTSRARGPPASTPVLVDPYGLHPDVGCPRVRSLAEVPALIRSWS